MRIAMVTTTFPSISQTFVLNQITGLLDLGQDIRVFALRAQTDEIHPDVEKYDLLRRTCYLNNPLANRLRRGTRALQWLVRNIHRHPVAVADALNLHKHRRGAVNLSRLFSVIPFLENAPFDVIHCQFAEMGRILASFVSGIPHKLFVTSLLGHDIARESQICDGINDELISEGDAFLSLSCNMDEKLTQLGFPVDRIIRHTLGIELWKFEFSERVYSLHRAINLLTAARLVEKKGVAFGIRAVAAVLAQTDRQICYRIAGDGPLRDELEGLASELGISRQVEFLGWQDQAQIRKLYQQADLFILPSITASDGDQEGTPVSLLEAQAVGLPVLSTLHSGIPEIVENGTSGYLVPERDVDALAEQLEHLIIYPEEWPTLGREGRRIVEERHDVRKLNQRLIEIYEQKILERK